MTRSSRPTPPWLEHRQLAESIGETVMAALHTHTGSSVNLGKATSFEPETHLKGRPLPLRATVVNFHRPLRDVLVFISSYNEDALGPLVEVAAAAALDAVGIQAPDDADAAPGFSIDPLVEYETFEDAIDHTDALYLEGSYTIELPLGDVLMVVGSDLLRAAARLGEGLPDTDADDAGVDADLLEAVAAVDAAGGEFTPDQPRDGSAAGDGEPIAPGIDSFDAVLAAQERADADAAARDLETAAENARALEARAAQEHQAERWTQLLSGVEVELSAELGRADLALGEITGLSSESVLLLDQFVQDPVPVYVNGTRYATARLVVVDGEYGIEILEVVADRSFAESLAA